jgi:hypothetical protein
MQGWTAGVTSGSIDGMIVKSDDKTLETSLTLSIFVVFLLSFTLLPYKEGPCD